jgi:hypothetical protein
VVLWAALRYRRTGSHRDLAAAALAGSLGLAHHLTIVLLVPGLLVLIGHRLWTDPAPWRRLAIVAALLAVGPVHYLFLMVWARGEPLQDWGRPVTLALLWDHASARFYHGWLCLPGGPRLWHRLALSGTLYIDDFPLLAFLLPLLGGWMLWRKDRATVAGLLLAVIGVLAFNLCYQITDIAAYFLAAWIIAAALMALALDILSTYAGQPWARKVLIAGACSWLVVTPLVRNWLSCDLSQATWVREFARQKLENADPGSVLISAADDDTFPLWYVHDVLKVRPDVFQVDRNMVDGIWRNYDRDPSLWYLCRLRHQGVRLPLDLPHDLPRRDYLALDGFLIDLLQGPLHDRPVCMTFLASSSQGDASVLFRWITHHCQTLPIGLLVRLQPRSRPVDLRALIRENERRWARMAPPDLHGVRTDDELDPDYIPNHYACSLVNFGGLYEIAGDRARAEALYRRAARWAPGYQPAKAALAGLVRHSLAG